MRVASLEPGEESTKCNQPPPGRPPNNHSHACSVSQVSVLSPMFAHLSSQHPLLYILELTAFWRLEGKTHVFVCLGG